MKASTVTIPVKKNHMEIHWHDYADKENPVPIAKASLDAKASVIGRVGIMMLACGTGAWRVRSSMNELSELMNITCTGMRCIYVSTWRRYDRDALRLHWRRNR